MRLDLAPARDVALDVWDDLCRTRLATIAIALALTLVAIAVIVLRPQGPPEIKTGYAAANAAPAQHVRFDVPGEQPLEISEVELSDPRDPFRSLDQIEADTGGEPPAAASETDEIVTASSSSSGDSATTTTGGSSTTELVPLEQLDYSDSGGGGGSGDSTGGNSTGPSETGDDGSGAKQAELSPSTPLDGGAEAPVTDYSYAADLQYGQPSKLRRYRSVGRLELVPSRRLPHLMFLGVTPSHRTAVFMVDSRLSQGGEGKCVPSPATCTFLELQANPERDEHRFRDADGTEYLLRLRGLERLTASTSRIGGPDANELPGSPALVDGSNAGG